MITTFIEATNGPQNWGKFMLGRWTKDDWERSSKVDPERPLLAGRGWTADHFLMVDLQTGEGAVFYPGGLAAADLDKHRIWVCPLFAPTLEWIYTLAKEKGFYWWEELPSLIDVDAPFEAAGYRRPGPPS